MHNMLNNIFCKAVINKYLIYIILQVHFIHLIYTKTSSFYFAEKIRLLRIVPMPTISADTKSVNISSGMSSIAII